MKRSVVVLLSASCFASGYARGQGACLNVPKGDPPWQQIDAQYARVERAMIAKDAKQLFAVYAPDFEARTSRRRSLVFQASRRLLHRCF